MLLSHPAELHECCFPPCCIPEQELLAPHPSRGPWIQSWNCCCLPQDMENPSDELYPRALGQQ